MFSQDCFRALRDKEPALLTAPSGMDICHKEPAHSRKAFRDLEWARHKGTAMIQVILGENGITNIGPQIPIYLQHRPLLDLPHKDLFKAPHKDPLVGHMVVIPTADQVDQVEDQADQAFQVEDQADPADQAFPAEDQVFKDQDKQQNAGSLPRPGHQVLRTPLVSKPIFGC